MQIPQKTVRYRPSDKLREVLGGSLCGAKTIAQHNVTIRTDRAVQRACGRTGWAEQSTMARPLRACTAEHVAQLAQVFWSSLKRYGVTPRHRFRATRWWVDLDLTPRPLGAQAEGRERPWRGRNRSTTGRKTLRITARPSRASLHETLLRGQATAVPALQAALLEVETSRGWPRERRAQMVLRVDGGFGTPEVLNGLLRRGSQVVAKRSNRGRGQKVRQAVGPWQPPASPGRELAAVRRPHRCWRTTRPWVMRTPKAQGGCQEAGVLTTWPDLAPATVAEADDSRARIEATLCQEKQALG